MASRAAAPPAARLSANAWVGSVEPSAPKARATMAVVGSRPSSSMRASAASTAVSSRVAPAMRTTS